MKGMSVTVLAGVIFACSLALSLGGAGWYMWRKGLSAGKDAERSLPWHRRPLALFGLNNVVFALLILAITAIALIIDAILRFILAGILFLLFALSVVLVVRCVLMALQVPMRTLPQADKPKSTSDLSPPAT